MRDSLQRGDVRTLEASWLLRESLFMAVYRPKSFLQLVLLGFSLVTLPLIVSIVSATLYVDRLADTSQQAVHHAVEVTKSGRALLERLLAMERHARQYRVLGDESLLQTYATMHKKFQATATHMTTLPLDEYQQQQLRILVEKELEIFSVIHNVPHTSVESEKATGEFVALTRLVESILAKGNQFIDRELDSMQAAAVKAQRVLVWQALAVIPGTILFATIFVTLISRPIKQIRHAIRRLGDADFTPGIAISGPRDLQNLGRGLDWLRVRLRELEEEKRKFLSHVSHELKTPLAAIREGVELLDDELVGKLNQQQCEIVDILQQKSKHLQKLIENLLNFSMTQARHSSLVVKPIQLDRLIDAVTFDHKPGMIAKDVQLKLIACEVWVMGDDEKLRVVVDNLLSNAVKYSPDGSTIQVVLEQHDHTAILDVFDMGPGIAPHEADKVFEAFYQGQFAFRGHIKGSGLGLSIAREYLMAHHGTIEVVNDRPHGAHFRVTLPANTYEDRS